MSHGVAWLYLIAAGVVDVAWALTSKKADGFRNLPWTALSLLLLATFVYLLTRALSVLPVGTAYAIWTGIGAAGTAMLGIALFDEPATAARLASIVTIVGGTICLHLASN